MPSIVKMSKSKPKKLKQEIVSSPSTDLQQITNRTVKCTEELTAMLYVFGDEKEPLVETVAMAEVILEQNMRLLCDNLNKIAKLRGSSQVSIEEFIFHLRNQRNKLIRFAKHMKHKELAVKIKKKMESALQETDKTMKLRRTKAITDCLSLIGCHDIIDQISNQDVDVVKMQRLQTSENRTRYMPHDEYLYYIKCKEICFVNPNRFAKFKAFVEQSKIMSDPSMLTTFGWESLAFMAQEEVAELVEAALIVKHDKTNANDSSTLSKMRPLHAPQTTWDTGAPNPQTAKTSTSAVKVERTNSSNTFTEAFDDEQQSKKRKLSSGTKEQVTLLYDLSLKPNDLLEAVRRKQSSMNNKISKILSKKTGWKLSGY